MGMMLLIDTLYVLHRDLTMQDRPIVLSQC